MFALELVTLVDPARREEALRHAVMTNELPIALWAVSALLQLARIPGSNWCSWRRHIRRPLCAQLHYERRIRSIQQSRCRSW